MWILLYSLIILTAVVFIPMSKVSDAFWIPKELIFNLLGFSILASCWIGSYEKVKTFKNKWFGLALIYVVIGFIVNFYFPLMFNSNSGKVTWHLWTLRPTINLILGLLLIQTLVEYTDNLHRWLLVSKLLCYLAFGFSIYAICQYFGYDQIFNTNGYRFLYPNDKSVNYVHTITFFGQHTLTANFLAIISPLCLMFKNLRFKLIYVVIFIAILLCNSMLSVLAFVVGLACYLFLMKRYKLFITIMLALLLTIISSFFLKIEFLSSSGRIELWRNILSESVKNIFTGVGLGRFPMAGFKVVKLQALSAHSELLQIFYENGLIMLTLVFGYLTTLFVRIFTSKKTMLNIGYFSALVSFLIIFLAAFPLRIAPLAVLGILYISALEVQI